MALTGNVSRWFNRKGYGFINVVSSDSEHVGNDLFVHLSGINIQNDGYKCLYPGEYVSFDLDTGKDGKFICVNVSGVMGGPLLVEHPEYRFKYFQKNRDNNNNATTTPTSDATTADVATTATADVDVDDNDPEQ
jgi:cold shock CspA family protein